MSQHPTPSHDQAHTGPIKTPKQLALTSLLAFVVPIFALIGLAIYVSSQFKPSGSNDETSLQRSGLSAVERARNVEERIQKVGSIEIKATGGAPKTGEEVFKAQCSACHGSGLAGAPKFGDAAAWGARLSQGFEALVNSALKGKGAMGAQGGGDFSDFEIARAVAYMANAGGGKFPEPKPPEGTAAADAGATSAPAAAPSTAAATPAAEDQASVKVENGVVKFYFATGKADLATGANDALAEVVKAAKAGKKLTLSGFHDAQGDAAKNAELAKQRALNVRDVLKTLGVAENQMNLKKPEQMQGTGAEGRRVEVAISE